MLSLRLGRRLTTYTTIAAAAPPFSIASSNNNNNINITANDIKRPLILDQPALIKLKAERNPDKLFQLFKANATNRAVIENQYAFDDTVSRLAGAGRFDYVEELLEHQKTLKQGRREGFVMRIIMLYGKAGMVKHAVGTYKDMHLYGCSRTVKSLNAVLKVLAQTGDLEAFESFFGDVRLQYDVEFDVVSLNIVIDAFCRMGMPDKACILMGNMETSGIRPDVVTYTTLISAFYKLNRAEIGNGIWNLMVMRGCLPNLATFNARVQFLVSRGRAWQANSLMGMMRYIGITPDEVTFNLVIKGFCRAGYLDMAKRVYSALHDEGYKPNARIYQTMMHYLCREGEFDAAYTMCKNSMENNWFPSVDSIYQLLQGLQSIGKVNKARSIISLVRKRTPSFSEKQLRIMESFLKKS